MKILPICLMILLLTACNKEPATVVNYGINHVSDVEVESIEKGNELYYKLTITQKLDRRAPTYVTDIRELKWINKLSWSLQYQAIGETSATSVFHIRPLVPMDTISLRREDFVWYPESQNFLPIDIDNQKSNHAAN